MRGPDGAVGPDGADRVGHLEKQLGAKTERTAHTAPPEPTRRSCRRQRWCMWPQGRRRHRSPEGLSSPTKSAAHASPRRARTQRSHQPRRWCAQPKRLAEPTPRANRGLCRRDSDTAPRRPHSGLSKNPPDRDPGTGALRANREQRRGRAAQRPRGDGYGTSGVGPGDDRQGVGGRPPPRAAQPRSTLAEPTPRENRGLCRREPDITTPLPLPSPFGSMKNPPSNALSPNHRTDHARGQ